MTPKADLDSPSTSSNLFIMSGEFDASACDES
jgi:hypothetical protein